LAAEEESHTLLVRMSGKSREPAFLERTCAKAKEFLGAAAERSVLVKAIRLIFASAAVVAASAAALVLLGAQVRAQTASDTTAAPAAQSAKAPKADKTPKPTHNSEANKSDTRTVDAHKSDGRKADAHKPDASAKPSAKAAKAAEPARKSEKAKLVAAHAGAKTASSPAPAAGVISSGSVEVPRSTPAYTPSTVALRPSASPPPPTRTLPAFAMAATASTSPLDTAAVKQAIELVHRGRPEEATGVQSTISDPLARKLVEWVILRGDDADLDFPRYVAFIAANPSWPGIGSLRRRAEAALWQRETASRTVIEFFRSDPPRTARGRLALARALLSEGDRAGAQAAVREAWRKDGFPPDVEAQARDLFAGMITPADDKARMDARLDADDEDGGLRAAHHLDPVQAAIAKARVAIINKSHKAKALLEEVPAEGRHDPAYIFARVQYLRRIDKIAEAAQWMQSAPREAERLGDLDQWWVERRLIARKLLDLGDFKAAYAIADGGAAPPNENYRSEQQFTAGWIALRFLREPAVALSHFARIAADGVTNPITLARSYYWQGRAAEALGREREARTYYETAARYPTAYYGQLARARLGIEGVTLRGAPEPTAEHYRLEVARAFEILYAIDEREIIANMAADLGDKSMDAVGLATLAEIAKRHNDARTTLLIGKTALGHGLPLEHYAFPDFGVPDYQQIGPEVERCVVYSIVRQESAFNSRVVSSANAIGLMQVTPAAGRDTAKRFNVSFDQRRLMADAVYNAQLGTAELGNDIASWRGSYILAFVAYNAGPRRAKEWIEQYGDPRNPKVDPIDWIERIPISETRNYVQRIIENMQVYRARFGADSRLMIEADLRRGG
jgi:soluble lytic murein transglycosylase